MWALSFFGDPGRYSLCDGSGEVALFAAETLDGLESQFFFQFIGECYADSSHVNDRHVIK